MSLFGFGSEELMEARARTGGDDDGADAGDGPAGAGGSAGEVGATESGGASDATGVLDAGEVGAVELPAAGPGEVLEPSGAVEGLEPEALDGAWSPEVQADLDTLEGLVDGVNPGYDPFDGTSPYSTNCGACALATYARLEGTDAGAMAGAENVGTISQMNALTGLEQTTMSPSEIEDYALAQGPGFHTVMGLDWAGTGSGHWVNVCTTETGVYVIDSQCGRAYTFSDYVAQNGPYASTWDIGIRREGR